MPWPKLPTFDQAPTLSATAGRTVLGPYADEMDDLAASLPEFVAKVYRHAEVLLGKDEAKKLFLDTLPKKKLGGHGPWTSLMPNRNADLLREYDKACRGLAPNAIKKLPRILGVRFDEAAPGKFGNSAAAIERHIRRLVSERKTKRAQQPLRSSTVLSGYGK